MSRYKAKDYSTAETDKELELLLSEVFSECIMTVRKNKAYIIYNSYTIFSVRGDTVYYIEPYEFKGMGIGRLNKLLIITLNYVIFRLLSGYLGLNVKEFEYISVNNMVIKSSLKPVAVRPRI